MRCSLYLRLASRTEPRRRPRSSTSARAPGLTVVTAAMSFIYLPPERHRRWLIRGGHAGLRHNGGLSRFVRRARSWMTT